ncbi:hypothetical protein SAY86_007680 [Trapa natans]|uniref:Uncharacterized protein n=1 Tax=Trapa natans TaxID=22666 RepID=A0AAN7LM70_TRANT|nr:hypothetical protein SAY86_007680 [Trapa natans]
MNEKAGKGDKLTSESVKFFSPIVIWTRFSTSLYLHDVLYSDFKDYLKALPLSLDFGENEINTSGIIANQEAQHRYLTWRAEKDPSYNLLKRLVGEAEAKTINEKQSMMEKSFERRPWNSIGEFIAS